jgi:hypothetical protein
MAVRTQYACMSAMQKVLSVRHPMSHDHTCTCGTVYIAGVSQLTMQTLPTAIALFTLSIQPDMKSKRITEDAPAHTE